MIVFQWLNSLSFFLQSLLDHGNRDGCGKEHCQIGSGSHFGLLRRRKVGQEEEEGGVNDVGGGGVKCSKTNIIATFLYISFSHASSFSHTLLSSCLFQ